ncbi:MAG: hypothetical protein ACOYL3_28145 [Desulfuromonadaceae bacterium]
MCESVTAFVPVAEAARLLETTEAEVLQMLNINKLQGKLVDAAWYVDRSSLDLCDKPKNANIAQFMRVAAFVVVGVGAVAKDIIL